MTQQNERPEDVQETFQTSSQRPMYIQCTFSVHRSINDLIKHLNDLRNKKNMNTVACRSHNDYHLDTEPKLNVHKTLRRRPGRLQNVL